MTITPLLDTMEQLIEVHEVLLQLSRDKTQVLVDNQVDQLNAIVLKEGRLLKKVADLDQQRSRDISDYLLARGYRSDPRVTISDLVRLIFKAEEKKALRDQQVLLLAKLSELREVNQRNSVLIEQSLAFIHYSLDLFTYQPEQDVLYQNPNHQQTNNARLGLFDTKA